MSTSTEPATVVQFDESEYFADPRKLTKIPVPAIRGWVEVRDEVSVGEERAIFAKSVKGQTTTKDGEQRLDYDLERVSFGTTALHIVDWSLKRPYSADALKGLKSPVYKAIDDAVQAHIKKVAEGNAPTPPSSGGAPTSASAK